MDKEIWKDIKGYNGECYISTYGNVKRIVKGEEKQIKKHKTEKGYLCVYINYKGKIRKHRIHKLVAEAFLPKENYKKMDYENVSAIKLEQLQINHIDENKSNNNLNNLEWCTCSYNINYGNRNKKVSIKYSKKVKQYDLDYNLIKEWSSLIDVQKTLGISTATIFRYNKSKPFKGYYWEYER